ncbi:MAG: bifunctional 3-deoxy-7-phosphoheptulonate synthase/chorismate mutase [Chloroflexi bacterium]|nr:bifunctional 3-deoxy-7-phosphoheptulonate synthase/chorismate mutase [Chloroflexota bacterium]
MKDIENLRERVHKINLQILELLAERGTLVREIGEIKTRLGLDLADARREAEMLADLMAANSGPYPDHAIRTIFEEVFRASLHLQEADAKQRLLAHRSNDQPPTVVKVKGVRIGGDRPVVIAGPCAIESFEQLWEIAREIRDQGIFILRGGAFKPRTSPHSFQGLGEQALKYLKQVTEECGMVSITEVIDVRDVDLVSAYADIIQIGARSMHNSPLLAAAGALDKPVMLKRGFMATVEELFYAAEYVMSGGNGQVILCERGIRTFERWTRNTLDLSAVAILKQESHLPVIVDVSHSAGRKDIVIPLAKAALGAGADGIMVEVHNDPPLALSDAGQQLDFTEFRDLLASLSPFLARS